MVPYFFFGTLMDLDVLELVLDRPVRTGELCPGIVDHFRRVRALAASYPVLVPDPGGEVAGVILTRPSHRDALRIRHFEDEEYVEVAMEVRTAMGTALTAHLFRANDALGTTSEPWSLQTWVPVHKAGYLDLCRSWMSDCPA